MFESVANLARWLVQHWLLVLPVLLGFLAIWLLLPQARRRPVLAGAGLSVLAVVLGGLALLQPIDETVPHLLFYLFAGLAVTCGVCMIVQRNPVYAALWFALVILSTCGLFLLQAAPFLAAATIVIYAGAIIVTFLFVIMLAQQTGLATYDRRSREPLLASLAGFILLGALLYTLQMTYTPPGTIDRLVAKLDELQARLDRGGMTEEDFEEAMYFSNEETVDLALRKEADRLAAWRDRNAAKRRINEIMESNVERKETVAQLRDVAGQIRAAGLKHQGMLPARMGHPSRLSEPSQDAGHVASLGRSLFGDYLWAVELAGTLLLIATVGAIAIAARREVVRS